MYSLFTKYAPILTAIAASLLLFSCDLFQDSDSGSDGSQYRTAVANSNYDRIAKTGNTVYFDFSTGTVTSVDHSSWDLAISHSTSTIVANSGSYGSGVTVYKTGSTTITDDFSSSDSESVIYGHTYIDGTDLHGSQTSTNPFSGEFTSGSGSGTVYLVQDVDGNYFKVTFSSFTPGGSYSLQVLAGLAATGSGTTINGTSDTAYGYTYFKLSSASDVTTAVTPRKDAFDVMFTPAEYIFDASQGFHSYPGFMVLINNEGAVQGATADGSSIDQVLSTSGLSFSSSPSALGNSWYTYNTTTNTISINTLTYVVKTTEGHYAKFQPASYTNSDDTIKYYMTFRYYYQDDGSGTFSE